MNELACLFYEVRKRFYQLTMDQYFDACREVSDMAQAQGYTLNDLAKILIQK